MFYVERWGGGVGGVGLPAGFRVRGWRGPTLQNPVVQNPLSTRCLREKTLPAPPSARRAGEQWEVAQEERMGGAGCGAGGSAGGGATGPPGAGWRWSGAGVAPGGAGWRLDAR